MAPTSAFFLKTPHLQSPFFSSMLFHHPFMDWIISAFNQHTSFEIAAYCVFAVIVLGLVVCARMFAHRRPNCRKKQTVIFQSPDSTDEDVGIETTSESSWVLEKKTDYGTTFSKESVVTPAETSIDTICIPVHGFDDNWGEAGLTEITGVAEISGLTEITDSSSVSSGDEDENIQHDADLEQVCREAHPPMIVSSEDFFGIETDSETDDAVSFSGHSKLQHSELPEMVDSGCHAEPTRSGLGKWMVNRCRRIRNLKRRESVNHGAKSRTGSGLGLIVANDLASWWCQRR